MGKQLSYVRYYSIICFIIFIGCSTKPIIKMPDSLPPVVKAYKHMTIHAYRPGLVDTGIFMEEGDIYAIVATGKIDIGGNWQSDRNSTPSYGGLLAKIGNNSYFSPPFRGNDTVVSKSDYSGKFSLGISDGGLTFKGYAVHPDWYSDNRGSFSVDIFVWSSNDILKIEPFLQSLDHTNPNNDMLISLKNDFSELKYDKAFELYHNKPPEIDTNAYIENLSKAIQYCPGFIRAYDALGSIYYKEGSKEKAIETLKIAAELDSSDSLSYYLLARLLYEDKNFNQAYKYINKAISVNDESPDLLILQKRIELEADSKGPTLILYEPSAKRGLHISQTHENLTVRGLATDKDGVSWVKINQAATPVDEYGNFLKDIPISLGTNTILVEAIDGIGNRSRISVTVEGEKYVVPDIKKLNATQKKDRLYRKSFAIIIGINNYESWPSLEFASADAQAVRKKMEQTGFDNITLLIDRAATKSRILAELFHELPSKVGREDRVVFFFAGHGQTETLINGGKRGYIIPVDADHNDYPATSISMDQIRNLSRRISAKHILYVMDSCYSGLGLNRSPGVSPKISNYLRKVSSMRAVQIITAGGKDEQVQEKEGHGLFTTYFLKALDGEADINKDNVVSGTELGAYLRPIVSNASNQDQTPLYGRLEGEGEFLFFVVKN